MIRPILFYPDKRLRNPGKQVEEFDAALRELIDDMAETMYAAPGVGLAAPQLGISKRIFIVDVATEEDEASDGGSDDEDLLEIEKEAETVDRELEEERLEAEEHEAPRHGAPTRPRTVTIGRSAGHR